MTLWEPHQALIRALETIDTRLAKEEPSAELHLARADHLTGLGRFKEAQEAYLTVLRIQPDHLVALNNFGAMVHGLGFISAARTLYAEAVRQHPSDPMANVNLGNSLAEAGEAAAAQQAFEAALRADPDYASAHQGMAQLASNRGDLAASKSHLSAAFINCPVTELPYRGAQSPIEVLLLISGIQGDIPLRHVLDPTVFRVTALAPQFFNPHRSLPTHQVVFNAIGDVERCAEALAAASSLALRSERPVINLPERVLETSRAANGQRLGAIPHVVTAACIVLPKTTASALTDQKDVAALGLSFPLAVRAPGFHTGDHFERVDRLEDLRPLLDRLPGDETILMDFLDTRARDGKFRKYRVMVIDGQILPVHVGVSANWKVHYFSADMVHEPANRAEDAAFLQDMAGVIGSHAVRALEEVRDILGLDYGGIDFALSTSGDVVLFEANATMVVYPPPDDPMWDYRREPVRRILQAIKAMIVRRAAAPVPIGSRNEPQ